MNKTENPPPKAEMLGASPEASTDMQVVYLGTCLTGEVQEWFYRNVEQYDCQVHEWTLETVVQGSQKDSCIP